MPYFEVVGYGRDTNRKRTRKYFAHNQEGAIYKAGDDGTIVETITLIPDPPKKAPEPKEQRSFFSKISGTGQQNPDGSYRQDIIPKYCTPGMPLVLRREPSNPYDPLAIGLWIEVKTIFSKKLVQIGYVGEHLTEELAEIIDQGESVAIQISQITGGDGYNYGVNIEITKW